MKYRIFKVPVFDERAKKILDKTDLEKLKIL
jgi:hypothetical protein